MQGSTESHRDESWLMLLVRYVTYQRGVRVSVIIALAILFADVVLSGSFLTAFLVCPLWLLLSILKNAVQRPGWRLAVIRISIPVATLGLVFANNAVQIRVAEANALQIIKACEGFHAANGKYPKTLDELVPQYMPCVPRAKYCLWFGEFRYWNFDEQSLLVWQVVPPYRRRTYDFEKRELGCLD